MLKAAFYLFFTHYWNYPPPPKQYLAYTFSISYPISQDDRPKSRAAFGDPAIENSTGKDSLTVSHLTNGSARKNSISNGSASHNGSALTNGNAKNGSMVNGSTVFGSSLSTNSETGEEEVKKGEKKDEDGDSNDEKDVEKKVADCFPPVMRNWCQLKCPCKVCKDPENSTITPKWAAFRKGVCILVEHRIFEWIILFVIAASSFTLVSLKYNCCVCYGTEIKI